MNRYVLQGTINQKVWNMISIKRLLENINEDRGKKGKDLPVPPLRQMGSLLLDGMATHVVRGHENDLKVFRRTLTALERQINEPQSAIGLLGISSDAVEALETYSQRTNAYISEGNEQMSSMIAVLTETVVEMSDQTDASVSRLQAIEKQVELASGLDDWRALRANLENCLLALREAAAQQRVHSANIAQRLQQQIGKAQQRTAIDPPRQGLSNTDIDLMPELSEDAKSISTSYVAAFKLQRAEHIASRFGEDVKNQMLSLIGTQLKTTLGPNDRLLRWKGTSFVLFLKTTEAPAELRRQLSNAMAAIRQQYIDVGSKSALLSVAADWIMFPESQCPSIEAVFAEVDVFLDKNGPRIPFGTEAMG
jgi:GGDEF domain-containing protein